MEMDWIQAIQSLGFPIAIAAVMLWYMSKITNRNMDEAKDRETNYQKILTDYSVKMTMVSDVLLKMNGNLEDARTEHREIMKYMECVEDTRQVDRKVDNLQK